VERWWKRMTERGECDDEDCPDAFLCCKLEAGGQSRACQSLVAAALFAGRTGCWTLRARVQCRQRSCDRAWNGFAALEPRLAGDDCADWLLFRGAVCKTLA
jgi:hypothetical protein